VRLLGRPALSLLTTIALAACCAGCGHHGGTRDPHLGSALDAANGFTTTVPITTHDLLDIGIPDLHNKSDVPLRILTITLRRPSAAVRYGRLEAFSYRRVGSGIVDQLGHLTALCPNLYRPLPPSALVVPPKQAASWFGVIPTRVIRPGRYLLGRFRVTYRMGQSHVVYHQDISLSETLQVRVGPAQRIGQGECDRPGEAHHG